MHSRGSIRPVPIAGHPSEDIDADTAEYGMLRGLVPHLVSRVARLHVSTHLDLLTPFCGHLGYPGL